jgi:hypothetical protein
VTYSTIGRIDGSSNTYTYGSGGNVLTMSYTPKGITTIDIPGDALASDIGSFNIQVTGNVTLTDDIRFEIVYPCPIHTMLTESSVVI